MTKPDEDDYVTVIANAEYLRDQDVDIPKKSDVATKATEDKPLRKTNEVIN